MTLLDAHIHLADQHSRKLERQPLPPKDRPTDRAMLRRATSSLVDLTLRLHEAVRGDVRAFWQEVRSGSIPFEQAAADEVVLLELHWLRLARGVLTVVERTERADLIVARADELRDLHRQATVAGIPASAIDEGVHAIAQGQVVPWHQLRGELLTR